METPRPRTTCSKACSVTSNRLMAQQQLRLPEITNPEPSPAKGPAKGDGKRGFPGKRDSQVLTTERLQETSTVSMHSTHKVWLMSTSSSREPIRLTAEDLFSPKVEAFLDEQAALNRALPETTPQPFIVRVLYSSYFYLSLSSGLGAFLAWLISSRSSTTKRHMGFRAGFCCFQRSRLNRDVPGRCRGNHVPQRPAGGDLCGGRSGRGLYRRHRVGYLASIMFAITQSIALAFPETTPHRVSCRRAGLPVLHDGQGLGVGWRRFRPALARGSRCANRRCC